MKIAICTEMTFVLTWYTLADTLMSHDKSEKMEKEREETSGGSGFKSAVCVRNGRKREGFSHEHLQ